MRVLTAVVSLFLIISAPEVSAQSGARGPSEGAERDWFGQVQAGIRQHEYRFSFGPAVYRPESGLVHQAPNRALDLRMYLQHDGLEILERTTDGAPTVLYLALKGWGREGELNATPAGALREVDGRMERLRGALTETYVNSAAGLGLGWQIDGPPTGDGPLVLVMEVEHASARECGGGVEFISGGGRHLHLQAAQATTTDGRSLRTSWRVVAHDRLELRVEDGGVHTPFVLKSLLTGTADTTMESDQADALLGISVSSAGDVNGDGYSDVIVGAEEYDNGENAEGAAFVFLGSATGIVGSSPATAHAVLESNQGSALMGISVSTAGDVNGDGYADVIVGAKAYDNGENYEGAAFVFLGSASGIVGSHPGDAHAQIESNDSGTAMGWSVSTAGDVNGDGFSDVVVGGPYHGDPGTGNEGAAWVFLGSASGIVGSNPGDAHAQIESNQTSGQMGISVSTAGDVNGDGFADIIVGANGYNSYDGAAFVFHGSASGIIGSQPGDADAQLGGSGGTGSSVSSAGDVNGDGYSDVIVGGPYFANGETSEGAALVFLGSASGIVGSHPGDAHALLESNQAGAQMGGSVSAAGDVNGDGFADVIAGAPYYDGGEADEGAAFVFLGSAAGIVGSTPDDVDVQLESNQADAHMGTSVATAGDVNGDGFADVVIGAPEYDDGHTDEGAAFVFLGSGAGVVGSSPADAQAHLESDLVYGSLGFSVSTAGDVNGDGFADVIVGAPYYDNNLGLEGGAAFVFLGSATGVVGSSPADAHATFSTDQNIAYFGKSVSTAGDVNGDGYSDVIIGAPRDNNVGSYAGAAFVFLGSAAGLVGSGPGDAHATLEPDRASSEMGSAVASAGDVNGDGYSDIIVGAERYDNPETNEGAAFVFLGSAAGVVGSSTADAHAMIEADQENAYLGSSVSAAGDVNGDGFADVIVGAPIYDSGNSYEGAAFVFLGSGAGVVGSNPANAHVAIEANQDGAYLGTSVSTAGDVNGDGFADVIVGADLYDNGHYQEGAAFVFLGSAAGVVGSSPADAHATLESDQDWADMGSSVSTAGDVNGDGFSDIIVGARLYENGEYGEGSAFVFLGSAAGVVGSNPANAHAWIEANQENAHLGMSVSTAGDVNGDGFADIIVGADDYVNGEDGEGSAFVFFGNSEGRPVLPQQSAGGPSDHIVQPWGASSLVDGFRVGMRAHSPRGRELARLEVEACPSGESFGSPACAGWSGADWTDTTASAQGVGLEAEASGLDPGLYRWRARTLYLSFNGDQPGVTPPTNPTHGPWRRLGAMAEMADIHVLWACDLAIDIDDGQSSAVPGEPVSYTIIVTNPGPSSVSHAVVRTDHPIPLVGATWTCVASSGWCSPSGSGEIADMVTVPQGATLTYTLNAAIDPAAVGTLVTTATVDPPGYFLDVNPADNSDSDTDDLTPEADLGVTLDNGTDMAVVGRPLTYTITAFNPGPSDVPGAAVSDAFPTKLLNAIWVCVGAGGGSCTPSGIGDIDESVHLPVGASVTFTAIGTVDPAATGPTISNSVTIAPPPGVTETDPVDNTDIDVDTLWEEIFSDGFETGDTSAWS